MHDEVKRIYARHSFKPLVNAQDIVKNKWLEQTLENTRTTSIDSIIRLVLGEEQQFLLYDQTQIGETIEGRRRFLNERIGMYEKPHFVKSVNRATGALEFEPRIDWSESVYEHPFSPEEFRSILEKDQRNTKTKLYLKYNERTYTIASAKDMILPLEQLLKKLQIEQF
jgi:hypothetical protein